MRSMLHASILHGGESFLFLHAIIGGMEIHKFSVEFLTYTRDNRC